MKTSNYHKTILVAFLFLISNNAWAEMFLKDSLYNPEEKGLQTRNISFEYGLAPGFYIANPSTANFYNGSGENSLQDALNRSLNYESIRRELGYDFSLLSLPSDMSYRPAIMLGFFGKLSLGDSWGLLAEFNYTRLKAEDQFSIFVDNPSNLENENIRLFSIWGVEERIDLKTGLHYTFTPKKGVIFPFLEAGVCLTDIKVKEHRARILSTTISIRNPQNSYYQQQDYGMGFGGFGSAGLKIFVNESYYLTFGYSTCYSQLNLGSNTNFYFQHTSFIRLNLNNLIQNNY